MMTFFDFTTPLGVITAVCENGFITNIYLPGQTFGLPESAVHANTPELEALGAWLHRYFIGENPPVDIPLAPHGTQFQQRVWELLKEIPHGQSTTYGQLARRLGDSMSPQAVGQAVGRNPIPILIPCHRVLGVGGKLTGYAAGIDKKIVLLNLESIHYTD